MKKLDGIIFDVDGTLWDAVPAVYQAWQDELAEQGYPCNFSLQDMKNLFGQQVNTFGDVLFPELSIEKRRSLAHLCADHQIARMRNNRLMEVYSGVAETLQTLSKQYPLFIVTNAKDGYTQLFLEFSNTSAYIKDFEHANVENRSKADNIRILMERNGLESVIYVGDTATDQTCSKEAGATFIWASYGFDSDVTNDITIDTFSDLLKII